MVDLPQVSFGLLPQDEPYSSGSYKHWGVWNKETKRLISLPGVIHKFHGTKWEIPFVGVRRKGRHAKWGRNYTPSSIRSTLKQPIVLLQNKRKIIREIDDLEHRKRDLEIEVNDLAAYMQRLANGVSELEMEDKKLVPKLPVSVVEMRENLIPINGSFGAGVYFLFNREELVYVGVSNNIFVRIVTHRNDQSKKFDHIFFIYENDRQRRLALERAYIRSYSPKFNIVHNMGLVHDQYKDLVSEVLPWDE